MRKIISHKRDHNLRVMIRSLQRFLELDNNLELRRYGFSNARNERMRRMCCERVSFVSPPSCSALGRYILSTGSQVNWKFSVPPTQWRDISPEVSAEPIPREVIVRVSDSHIALTCTAPVLASRPTSSPVGSYLKRKPRTKEEIIKTQIGGSRFRTRKVYYISFFTYSLHRTRCYRVKNRLFTLYMELALKFLTNKSAHCRICKGELPESDENACPACLAREK